jgi:uncharacterized protein with HEPN domain
MTEGRQPVDWLSDAREYAREASRIAAHTAEGDLNQSDYLAIRYCLMVIGEALNQVPPELLASEADIPWHQIIALRHRLAHGYWLIDHGIIRAIALDDITSLIETLDRLIDRSV